MEDKFKDKWKMLAIYVCSMKGNEIFGANIFSNA